MWQTRKSWEKETRFMALFEILFGLKQWVAVVSLANSSQPAPASYGVLAAASVRWLCWVCRAVRSTDFVSRQAASLGGRRFVRLVLQAILISSSGSKLPSFKQGCFVFVCLALYVMQEYRSRPQRLLSFARWLARASTSSTVRLSCFPSKSIVVAPTMVTGALFASLL